MIYLVYSEIDRYDHPYQIILSILNYQSFVIHIINLLGAVYFISINLFLILISKLVSLTSATVRTLNMFIRLDVMLIPAIRKKFSIIAKGFKYRCIAQRFYLKCRESIAASLRE